jgi:pimeloyl-ACP methyl ester carboxylesterase
MEVNAQVHQMDFRNLTRGKQTWRFYDAGEGPAVVLLHGFPDTPQSWGRFTSTLNREGYRTIVPYLRGYHPDTLVEGRPYDALTLAEDVVGLLDALELETATLVGHDWGATLVYGAAAIAPERIDGVVPIAVAHPKTLAPKNALQTIGLFIMARHLVYFQLPWSEWGTRRRNFAYVDSIYRRWSPKWQDGERDAAVGRVKAAFEDPAVLTGAIDYYRAMFKKPGRSLSPLNPPLDTRALLVAGAEDFGGHLGPYKKTRGFFTQGADLLVIESAGHWPHQEHPTKFTPALLDFLAGTG